MRRRVLVGRGLYSANSTNKTDRIEAVSMSRLQAGNCRSLTVQVSRSVASTVMQTFTATAIGVREELATSTAFGEHLLLRVLGIGPSGRMSLQLVMGFVFIGLRGDTGAAIVLGDDGGTNLFELPVLQLDVLRILGFSLIW